MVEFDARLTLLCKIIIVTKSEAVDTRTNVTRKAVAKIAVLPMRMVMITFRRNDRTLMRKMRMQYIL